MPKPRTVKLYLNPIPEGKGRTDWDALDRMTDENIREQRKGSKLDQFDIDWETAEVVIVEPVVKKAVSIRLDSDVIEHFKSQGRGYQTRINAALRAVMTAQQKKAG